MVLFLVLCAVVVISVLIFLSDKRSVSLDLTDRKQSENLYGLMCKKKKRL